MATANGGPEVQQMISREEIRWAYKALLGREPEGEDAYRHHSTHADFESLRNEIITSEEGVAHLRIKMIKILDALPFDYFRSVTIFIHIPKTGGTAMHQWLCAALGLSMTSDAHTAYLSRYTLGELNQLDLISGHFTYQEALAIPREKKYTICCFREPKSRLISLYRFYRSQSIDQSSNNLVKLANTLTIEDFFSEPTVAISHEIDNRYLRVFCDGSIPADYAEIAGQGNLNLALYRLSKIDSVVISEQMAISASTITRKLGLESCPSPKRIHVTDELHRLGRFKKAPPIVHTRRLDTLLAPLVEHDTRIYEYACDILHG